MIMKIIRAAAFLLATVAQAEVTTFPVIPSLTDPAIKHFDEPHWIYVERDIVVEHKADRAQDRHELLLWLTGTGGKGHDAQGFSNLAADLGYHVVTLMFPDDIPAIKGRRRYRCEVKKVAGALLQQLGWKN